MNSKPDDLISTPLEKTDSVLSAVFETAPLDVRHQVVESVPTQQSDVDGQVEIDHQFARSNMYNLLHQGQSAFAYALEVAKSSENPRAFEVAGNIMKNLADMNNQLLELHEKKANIKKPMEKQEPQKVVNNSIVFQGSTADLNKMLSTIRKENT